MFTNYVATNLKSFIKFVNQETNETIVPNEESKPGYTMFIRTKDLEKAKKDILQRACNGEVKSWSSAQIFEQGYAYGMFLEFPFQKWKLVFDKEYFDGIKYTEYNEEPVIGSNIEKIDTNFPMYMFKSSTAMFSHSKIIITMLNIDRFSETDKKKLNNKFRENQLLIELRRLNGLINICENRHHRLLEPPGRKSELVDYMNWRINVIGELSQIYSERLILFSIETITSTLNEISKEIESNKNKEIVPVYTGY
ncbi:MAG: hypothetical protein Satyrvirus2_16 [Satyrvirus sp.]|uniref:Uncharacterized protein n=1 Tax=Satyrvirus sp. TaxID=2487771 RepID=A0A3G5ACP8_9VIRU|nr:MAG: hypothetical protein Satyrvirus2_16 [Satyrvirus sp.]